MQQTTITFLGTGDAFGSGGRLQACIMLQSASEQFLIDCGATALIAMRRLGIDPNGVTTILISHLHGDHFSGVPFFILHAHFVSRRTGPLIIAGPPGTGHRLRTLTETMFPGSFDLPKNFPLRVVELQPERRTGLGPAVVTAYEVEHPSGNPSLAFRIEWSGKVIAYSGDTQWTGKLIPAARLSDLFISEAYSFDGEVRHHMNVQVLKEHLDELACKRLIVTHMGESTLARMEELPFEHAEDGLSIQL